MLDYQKRYVEIDENIASAKTELEKLEAERKRKQSGMPEFVELDDLYRKYAPAGGSASQFSPLVTFETRRGPVSFTRTDMRASLVPSTREPAWIRFGKTNDTLLSGEQIQTFLEESAEAKEILGYKRITRKSDPTDYGDRTETLYRNGDMYFKTYFEKTRILETYDRFSFSYTYYVEIGSETRKKQAELEDYNEKLGS